VPFPPGRIAILGATSHLAGDFIRAVSDVADVDLCLFSRRPARVARWTASPYAEFASGHYDAIINFVGVGDPARRAAAADTIFEITQAFDDLALSYVRKHPECRYIFLSSGAAYGGAFAQPAEARTAAILPINALSPSDWYGAAKLLAECRHRALIDLPIVDLRIFSYFSRTVDLAGKFLVCDILRAIRERATLRTTAQSITRDYLHPRDFRTLIGCILAAPAANCAIDAYSRAPVDKMTLLAAMRAHYGLQYAVGAEAGAAGGGRQHYYSRNRKAAQFGYAPAYDSLDCLIGESAPLLAEQVGA
jgi:nucleoside-diphosphate-sugar epimerase